MLEFLIEAEAAPQGSKVERTNPKTGGRYMHESSRRLPKFRRDVARQLPVAAPHDVITTPVRARLIFCFVRKRTSKFTHPVGKTWPGDVDKLARAVLDCLVKARVIRDDALVVELACRKQFSTTHNAVHVRIEPIEYEQVGRQRD